MTLVQNRLIKTKKGICSRWFGKILLHKKPHFRHTMINWYRIAQRSTGNLLFDVLEESAAENFFVLQYFQRFLKILSDWRVVAAALSGAAENLAGHRSLPSGAFWNFCRYVHRLPCSCHCGNAGQYSHFCAQDIIQTWNRACDFEYGSRKALRILIIFLDGASQDSCVALQSGSQCHLDRRR